jgi:AcrR family transcriptional regulator
MHEDHRTRLLTGIALSIEEKGYAATTIADIARIARVSKRTFYEHFADKEACFMAQFEAIAERMLAVVAEAAAIGDTLEERLDSAVSSYLETLASRPELTSTYLVEIRAAGPRALELRRGVVHQFADLLRELVAEAGADEPGLRPLSRDMATAIVGGINELTLEAVEEDRAHELGEVSATAVALIRSVVLRDEVPAQSAR